MACRIWGSNPPQYSPHQNGNGHHSQDFKPLLQHKLKTIERVEDLTSTFSNTFLTTTEDGSLDINHKMVPSLADAVLQKLGDALAQQQVSRAFMPCHSTFTAFLQDTDTHPSMVKRDLCVCALSMARHA